MKTSLCVLLLSLCVAAVAGPLQPMDVFELEYVSQPRLSPDGQRVVYVRNFKDVMSDGNLSNLWIVDVDGKNHRPLTTGKHSVSQPNWSHDGKKLTFLSNLKDDEYKLLLMWVDSREIQVLYHAQQAPSGVAWSPDDQQLAFTRFVPEAKGSPIPMPAAPPGAEWRDPPVYIDTMRYRADGAGYLPAGYQQIFVLPADGGTARQITESAHHKGTPAWSADGQWLYYSANQNADHELNPLNSEIYRVALSGGAAQALTDRAGGDFAPQVSPDGKKVAYMGFDDRLMGHRTFHLYLMDADGGNKRALTADFDRGVEQFAWSSDSQSLYFMYTDHGRGKLGRVDLRGRVTGEVADRLGGLSLGRPYNDADFSLAGKDRLAYTLGSAEHPADLAVSVRGKVRRLTRLNDDLFGMRTLGQVQEMRWPSSHDERSIQGWLVTPPDFDAQKKYPMILEIHGGPFSSYGEVFSAEVQLYAAAGYVVLYTNPRGSTGYGDEFANLIHHNYPGQDYDDLMSGVDAVLEKGFVDPEQLYVTGGSGGGVLTAWIVGKTDRFRAAVVAKPVINWTSFVLYSDNPNFFYKYWFGAKPWERPDDYLRRSPLSLVGEVTTPTMLLTGEADHRTPIAESEQYYAALKLQQVDSALVRIPDASHGIASTPSQLIAKVNSILYWFGAHAPDSENARESATD